MTPMISKTENKLMAARAEEAGGINQELGASTRTAACETDEQ